MKLKNPIREIRKAMTPPCTQCVHSRFKAFDNVTILCDSGAYLDHVERTCCDPYKWTCARCGKTHCNPFFTCYPREFWKDNKKRVGAVCEKCRDEIDYSNVREEQK